MKQQFLSILKNLLFWNFMTHSFSKKRKKAMKRKKNRTTIPKNSAPKKSDLAIFKDDKGIVCFSIQLSALFYIESDTNYITVFYANQGKMEKYLMRSSLKMVLEENITDNLVRCHRSYIVNFDKVKLYKKDKDGGVIELLNDSLPSIPVSKSYIENVLHKFQFQ
ncbi:MAG: LytTR family transcriptional regulator [Bacteroidales bacterium]|jgi:DNA-binding LytR/AlgR family response regulator|nr:LytTR family transcriptional regulator [Bacteroidales bacterium]